MRVIGNSCSLDAEKNIWLRSILYDIIFSARDQFDNPLPIQKTKNGFVVVVNPQFVKYVTATMGKDVLVTQTPFCDEANIKDDTVILPIKKIYDGNYNEAATLAYVNINPYAVTLNKYIDCSAPERYSIRRDHNSAYKILQISIDGITGKKKLVIQNPYFINNCDPAGSSYFVDLPLYETVDSITLWSPFVYLVATNASKGQKTNYYLLNVYEFELNPVLKLIYSINNYWPSNGDLANSIFRHGSKIYHINKTTPFAHHFYYAIRILNAGNLTITGHSAFVNTDGYPFFDNLTSTIHGMLQCSGSNIFLVDYSINGKNLKIESALLKNKDNLYVQDGHYLSINKAAPF